jgi:V/A-type H+-transporting ATPase subunit D
MPEVAATRSAALALAEERALMRQGYRFLDEKRVLIASELLRRLRAYEALMQELRARVAVAHAALRATLQRHGLDGLHAYPAAAPPARPWGIERTRFLGVALIDVATASWAPQPGPDAVDRSPQAVACTEAFAALAEVAARLAACTGNLERLANEYRRTERRARALENVLLPEVERTLATVQEHLDLADLEEVARTRLAGRRTGGPGVR